MERGALTAFRLRMVITATELEIRRALEALHDTATGMLHLCLRANELRTELLIRRLLQLIADITNARDDLDDRRRPCP
jgi:hypothetical protein